MYNKEQQNEVAGEHSCKLLMSTVIIEMSNKEQVEYQDGDLQLLKMNITEYLQRVVGVQYGSKRDLGHVVPILIKPELRIKHPPV